MTRSLAALDWGIDLSPITTPLAEVKMDDDPPQCGHSACRQQWVDTGEAACVELDVVAECSGCQITYDLARFQSLLLVGDMDPGIEGYTLELHNCDCGSTLAAARSADGGYLSRAQWGEVEADHG